MKLKLPILYLTLGTLLLSTSCARKVTEQGQASFYADKYQGRKTASGEKFRQGKMTAAHRTLPFGTKVKVTNLSNGKSIKVRINDRGPFVAGRIIDLSRKGARKLDIIQQGVAPVKITYKK
ncbi:septal ring lytic transglycosylase RlpA family protein [Penaeicola halotolerans]|uniref:septal ring lytic transglycosylase RlpA family protein n=1 Tax=Penaeicola halotolerans TaxID=2793196 RepID=UPI001CF8294F|nr:septal ring lytic transglycosylase RlpA family protein [Penaeicola halotolerans]